ncbi:threonine/serine exporter family protein [Kocuria palustris]|uniref:threonine/serine exporter family protein n=1 Tax=Kocuria palustris TaxID=71999 RepID=UPI002468B91D|nr:threonine/serine exporter family protein [Kocuria palustris]MDH5150561.1 threonine/serine exporter family protein [Kocuria palustris]
MPSRDDDAFRLAMLLGEALIRGGASSAATTTCLQRALRSAGVDDATVGVTMGQIILSRPGRGTSAAINHVSEAPPGSLDLELRRRITAMLDDLAQGRRTVRECLAELGSREADGPGCAQHAGARHAIPAAGLSLLGVGFCLLMGGTAATTLCAGVLSVAAYAAFAAMQHLRSPGIFSLAAAGLTAVLGATAATAVIDDAQTALCIVAALAAWLAGITAYGAAQDMITGWYLSAAGRVMDIASRTAGLVAGVALGIHLMAPFVGESVAYIEALRPDSVTWATAITGAVLVSGGYGLASSGRGIRLVALAALGGLVQLLVLIAQAVGLSSFVAILAAAVAVGAICVRAAPSLGLPSNASMMIALLPLFPGSYIYQGMLGTIFGVDGSGDQLIAGAVTALCLSMGGLLGQFLASRSLTAARALGLDDHPDDDPAGARPEARQLPADTLQHVRL